MFHILTSALTSRQAAKRSLAVPLKKKIFLSKSPVVAFICVSASVAEPSFGSGSYTNIFAAFGFLFCHR